MILAGCLASCEKSDIEKQNEKGHVIVRPIGNDNRGGGDDEEDPIVDGLVEDGNGVEVPNAEVEIFEARGAVAIDSDTTDSNGIFQVVVPVGDYYFEVTSGGSTTTTDTISITQNSFVTITI